MRAPVLASRRRSSPAFRSTSSHRRVRISLSRHPVSISNRSAAAARAGNGPSASRTHSSQPIRLYSSSVRNRSRLPSFVLAHETAGVAASRSQPPVLGQREHLGQHHKRTVRCPGGVAELVVQRRREGVRRESGPNQAPHIDPRRPGASSAGLPAPNRRTTWDRGKSW